MILIVKERKSNAEKEEEERLMTLIEKGMRKKYNKLDNSSEIEKRKKEKERQTTLTRKEEKGKRNKDC